MEVNAEDYFTYDARLASFKMAHKRRGSTKGKATKWPHAHLKADALAAAGWYYVPHPNHPDQVLCFLCRKGLDGWEDGDDALIEHLRHAPECGWAIVAAIDAGVEAYAGEDPKGKRMVEARKGTFAGRWPHEGKKGWKCKTKQLADAGWKYTPTPESDDMATCVYCDLALDGWEPGDKPMDEHRNRSPDCPFFTFVAPKKPRGKAARASKASRASVLSTGMGTFVSEGATMLDAEIDDSVVTTTSKRGRGRKAAKAEATLDAAEVDDSVVTTASKRGRPKKATKAAAEESVLEPPAEVDDSVVTTASKRGRPKKATKIAVEESALDPPAEVNDSVMTTASKRGRPKKATKAMAEESVLEPPVEVDDSVVTTASKRGRPKKATKAVAEESVLEPPAEVDDSVVTTASKRGRPKKATAKGRKTRAKNDTEPEEWDADQDETMPEAPPKPKRGKKRASEAVDDSALTAEPPAPKRRATRAKRAPSNANASILPETDVDMATDTEAPKKPGRKKAATTTRTRKASSASLQSTASTASLHGAMDDDEIDRQLEADLERPLTDEEEKGDYGMFDPQPMVVDEDVVDAELRAMAEEERRASERREEKNEENEVVVPKKGKGGKAGTRKASGKKAAGTRKASAKKKEPEPEPIVEPEPEPAQEPELEPAAIPEPSIHEDPEPEPEPEPNHDDSIASSGTVVKSGAPKPAKRGRGRPPKKRPSARESTVRVSEGEDASETLRRESEVSRYETAEPELIPQVYPDPEAVYEDEVDPEPELVAVASPDIRSPIGRPLPAIPRPAQRARASPTRQAPSPSPSPQSSDAENQPPSTQTKAFRSPTTPSAIASSPTKRTLVRSVRSAVSWDPIDIERVVRSPLGGGEIARRLGSAELESPEKGMTLEEWILRNAGLAEEALRGECEGLVGRFEEEGVRAMRALEGLRTE